MTGHRTSWLLPVGGERRVATAAAGVASVAAVLVGVATVLAWNAGVGAATVALLAAVVALGVGCAALAVYVIWLRQAVSRRMVALLRRYQPAGTVPGPADAAGAPAVVALRGRDVADPAPLTLVRHG